jgi:hypothetical protein
MSACATAADAASFGIKGSPYYGNSPAHTAKVAERYIRWLVSPRLLRLSDSRPEFSIKSPSRINPQWLTIVEDRLYRSVAPKDEEIENDGRWLRPSVVLIATGFFQLTSDLLPGEPYICGSQGGDLIAEFKAKHGNLTSIVTPTFVLLFAVVDGLAVERRFVFGSDSPSTIRQELRGLTEMLRTGRHGAVDTTK